MSSTVRSPDNMVYFAREEEQDTDLQGNKLTVRSAYPAYIESDARMKSGEQWAKRTSYRRTESECLKVEVPNLFNSLQILSLEVRGEGGRAYKVAGETAGGYTLLFDFREPALLDVLANVGIQKNGHMKGPFVWVVQGSALNLVRVGSEAHKKALEFENQFDGKKAVSAKDLEVGRLYAQKNGDAVLFLGAYYTTPHIVDPDRVEYRGSVFSSRQSVRVPGKGIIPDPQAERGRYFYWLRLNRPYGKKDVKEMDQPTLAEMVVETGYYYLDRTKSAGTRYATDITSPLLFGKTPEEALETVREAMNDFPALQQHKQDEEQRVYGRDNYTFTTAYPAEFATATTKKG